MTAKRKNGFETLDFSNPIVVHGGAQVLWHFGLMAAFSDKSPMPGSLKDIYKKNQIVIHISGGLIIFLLVAYGMSKQ